MARLRPSPRRAARLLVALVCGLLTAACGGGPSGGPPDGDAATPTFADVAPILYRRCSVCHRPGEAAPFSLLTYEDVRRRARLMEVVVESRYMPPWLPAPNPDPHVSAFDEDRSLTDDELETLSSWLAAGAPEGAGDAVPPPPAWPDDWQLGTPDLVLTMPRPFELPVEGRDVYRNFVIPATGGGPRYVRAVEWRPDNRQVLHHAVLYIDRSGGAMSKETADPVPGFGGMSASPALMPEGQFYGWTPGNVPRAGSEEFSWLLDDRTDVVLQLHLRPTGRPETIQVSIGFFFADAPPTRHPMSLRLRSQVIDIAPGVRDYVVKDDYVLPTDVEILGIYPHAHYLGKDLRGWAELPDGTERRLFHIPNWDFNWQDDYFYEEPVPLPRGTRLAMHYVFDNSAENPFNPSSPPVRVTQGEQSTDEMAELMMQVLPKDEADLPSLWRDFSWKLLRDDLDYYALLARSDPENAGWHRQLATLALRAGNGTRSLRHHMRWTELRPKNKTLPYLGIARAQMSLGEWDDAAATAAGILERRPTHVQARSLLGRAHLGAGRLEEARRELDLVLETAPGDVEALVARGDVAKAEGDLETAERCYAAASAADPLDMKSRNRLAAMAEGEQALRAYNEAVLVYRSNFPEADLERQEEERRSLLGLAEALRKAGRGDEALQYAAEAKKLELGQ